MRMLSLISLSLLVTACNGPQKSDSQQDSDGDGFSSDTDCNDNDASINPDATDTPGDGVDQDCSGGDAVTADADGDGYCGNPTSSADCPAEVDCDDANPDVNPGASEVWYDGVDQDCDGNDDDFDGDGVASTEAGGADCDDLNADVNPSKEEDCSTEADDNCDGALDSSGAAGCVTWFSDGDGDGYGLNEECTCVPPVGSASVGGDCDDGQAGINPAAAEVCDDQGIDEDCDGNANDADAEGALGQVSWYVDGDADAHGAGAATVSCELPSGASLQNDDCDDTNGAVYPGAFETPGDGVDADCDGSDLDSGTDDVDGDGWTYLNDCDDADASINPGAAELCDGIDQDCDGSVDDGATGTTYWYQDADGDNYGNPSTFSQDCLQPAGYVTDSTDCNDTDASINPAAPEILQDGIDQDCSGADAITADDDADGYDSVDQGGTDCDDNNAAINPGATEVCDAIDNNCDSNVDEGLTFPWYADADGDGYGDAAVTVESCVDVSGYVTDATDCDDTSNAVYPGATEICDGIDNDCDTLTDDADADIDVSTQSSWYMDGDLDGYGDAGMAVLSCAMPAGYVADASDCNDANTSINPSAIEICDGNDTDENCNGTADDQDSSVDASTFSSFAADTDGDGYGAGTALNQCDMPAGYVSYPQDLALLDCNDSSNAINPGAQEICDPYNTDEDCDQVADDQDSSVDSNTAGIWYADRDSDGFPNLNDTVLTCDAPAGYLSEPTDPADYDCNDADNAINPAATEICDASDVDENCNGLTDDQDPLVDQTTTTIWYLDNDNDTFGTVTTTLATCEQPAGYVLDSSDCNDNNAAISPAGQEICDANNIDEDCDGVADDLDSSTDPGTFSTWYADVDGDGFGDVNNTLATCEQPAGYLTDTTDCNDNSVYISPIADELCDSQNVDEDCNGFANNNDPFINPANQIQQWEDQDGDGYGNPALYSPSCDYIATAALNNHDCDDSRFDVNPSAYEVCDANNTDENCNSLANDADPSILIASQTRWYVDSDQDSYGSSSDFGILACVAPSGRVASHTDCNDGAAGINPGAAEICDGSNTDEDCDGLADDNDSSATGKSSYYLDADGDGYGDSGSSAQYCDAPANYMSDGSDCDDGDNAINPGANEICENGVDENCTIDCRTTGYSFDTGADATYAGLSLGSTTSGGFFGANLVGGKDVNGDGYADVAMADRLYDGGTGSAVLNIGRVYLFSGSSTGLSGTMAAPTAAITGELAGDRMGGGVGMVNDVDNDGDDELLVGAYLDNIGANTDAGSAYLYRGGGLTSTSLLPANASITISGATGSGYLGWLVQGAGDLTGDGVEDWVASSYFTTIASITRAGKVAIVSGGLSNGTYGLGTLNAISGESADDRMGSAIASEVDLNGDGQDDLLLMSIGHAAAYGFYGPISGSDVLSGADISIGGITHTVSSNETQSPFGLASAGDNDGDGYDDLVIGSDGYDGTYNDMGAAFLLTGPFTSNISSAASASDATVTGVAASDFAGRAVASAGDVDNDGFDDFLVGASGFDLFGGEGAVALLYGPTTGNVGITSPNVAVMVGTIASGSLGTAVAGVGSVDGDVYDDFLMGAPNDTTGGTVKYGKTFLYYGAGE